MHSKSIVWPILRIAFGFIFLWAFLDKVFGLGFATTAERSWLAGTSPAAGFLLKGTHGPLASFYQGLAGNPVVDWLFMLGLLGLGLALILGIGLRIAGYAGALMMVLMWSSLLPPENNPVVDDHIIYALLFLGFGASNIGHQWGLGEQWSQTKLVKRYPFLQ